MTEFIKYFFKGALISKRRFAPILLLFMPLLMIFFSLNVWAADSAEAYFRRARGMKNPEVQIKYYSIALKLDPEFKIALVARAGAQLKLNRLGEAVADLELYDASFPPSADSLVLHGKIAAREGRLDKAGNHYDQALELDKSHDEANLRKGLHLLTMASLRAKPDLYKSCLANFEAVSPDAPFYILARKQAARCYEHDKSYEQALEIYNDLIGITADQAALHFHRGRLLYFNDQFEEALKEVDKACDLTFNDRQPQVFYGVFRYYLEGVTLGGQTSADYHLQLFIKKFDSTPQTRLFLGELKIPVFTELVEAGLADKALPEKRRKSIACEMLTTLGYYVLIQGKKELAVEYFNRAAKLGGFGAYYYYLARFEKQRLRLAIEMGLETVS